MFPLLVAVVELSCGYSYFQKLTAFIVNFVPDSFIGWLVIKLSFCFDLLDLGVTALLSENGSDVLYNRVIAVES